MRYHIFLSLASGSFATGDRWLDFHSTVPKVSLANGFENGICDIYGTTFAFVQEWLNKTVG